MPVSYHAPWMSSLRRYALFQLPGIACVGLLLFVLWEWQGVPGWAAAAALAAWVAKDAALYPLLRRAYEPGPHGAAALTGRAGVVRRRLAPRGVVAIGPEVWRAEAADAAAIEAGAAVTVVGARGLTLFVVAVPANGDGWDG